MTLLKSSWYFSLNRPIFWITEHSSINSLSVRVLFHDCLFKVRPFYWSAHHFSATLYCDTGCFCMTLYLKSGPFFKYRASCNDPLLVQVIFWWPFIVTQCTQCMTLYLNSGPLSTEHISTTLYWRTRHFSTTICWTTGHFQWPFIEVQGIFQWPFFEAGYFSMTLYCSTWCFFHDPFTEVQGTFHWPFIKV